jgi:hypothetical protein
LPNDPTPGVVDESDFLYWRAHFGESLGAGSGAAASQEPGVGSQEQETKRDQAKTLPVVLVMSVAEPVAASVLAAPISASAENAPIAPLSLADSGRTTLPNAARISLPTAPTLHATARQDALLLAWVAAAMETPQDQAAGDAGGLLAEQPADETAESLCDSIDSVFETLGSGRDGLY